MPTLSFTSHPFADKNGERTRLATDSSPTSETITMKTLYLLLSILFVQACHPVESIAYDPLPELKKQEGHFEIGDVVARSDGGTVSLCLLLDSGTLWLTNRTDKKAHWSAVYETKDGFGTPLLVTDHDAELLLRSWIQARYTCAAILEIHGARFTPESPDDLIAATIAELVPLASTCSS